MSLTPDQGKRNYTQKHVAVHEHYRDLRSHQTLTYVQRMQQKYFTFDLKMGLWDAFELLNQFIDSSDPDLIGVPNIHHAFQTAEGLRKDGYPDYIQLVGLMHDLGKMLFVKGCDEDGTSTKFQYGVSGDTFIVGCKLSDKLVLSEYNQLNTDNTIYSSELGIYDQNCGFDKCMFSFGHDEYLYQVLINNRDVRGIHITLPDDALYIIRFHSFYPWHRDNAYDYLANEYDQHMKKTLQAFSKYDLYTKSYELFDDQKISDLKEYYTKLMNKYLGGLELWF
jgi:inositol oxygenase